MQEDLRLLEKIDLYVENLFAPQDDALEAALAESRRAGLPEIQVSPSEGKLLQLLAMTVGARRILEIGTLGGYSTIYLARALPEDGTLISLELEERHAEIAHKNIARAGLEDRVEIRTGDAKKLLAEIDIENKGPFDLTFIDADKTGYLEYLRWALKLSRPGSLILGDNTIRGGSVMDPGNETSRTIHEFNEALAQEPRLSATILPLMRERIDGLAIALVTGE